MLFRYIVIARLSHGSLGKGENMDKKSAMECFNAFPIYGITAEAMSCGRSNLEVVRDMLEGGVRFVQYREKAKSGLARYEECLVLKELAHSYGAAFVVDDFVDLALAVDADGVHIGQDDLPPKVVRQLLGPDKVIGWSTHGPTQLQAANKLADIIDYVGCGPVFATQTKATAVPVGLEYIKYAKENTAMPFVAIGGIKEYNIQAVKEAGASHVCVVSEIVSARNIKAKVQELAELMSCQKLLAVEKPLI